MGRLERRMESPTSERVGRERKGSEIRERASEKGREVRVRSSERDTPGIYGKRERQG